MKNEAETKEILRLSNEESNRLTRDCLRIAMIRLLDRKEFDRITITEIAQCAGVSRPAFYRNYDSKEGLVEDICNNVFSRLKEAVSSELYRADRKGWYTAFFRTIRENSEYFRIYRKAQLDVGELFSPELLFPSQTREERYINSAKGGAFFSILTDWFSDGMKESPEEMGGICETLIYRKFG